MPRTCRQSIAVTSSSVPPSLLAMIGRTSSSQHSSFLGNGRLILQSGNPAACWDSMGFGDSSRRHDLVVSKVVVIGLKEVIMLRESRSMTPHSMAHPKCPSAEISGSLVDCVWFILVALACRSNNYQPGITSLSACLVVWFTLPCSRISLMLIRTVTTSSCLVRSLTHQYIWESCLLCHVAASALCQ